MSKTASPNISINWQQLNKGERLERVKNVFPPSIKEKTNTVKEDLVLQYADHFREQYEQLFPHRPPLLLSPRNEYNVQKFISTFIKPTELNYPELYNCQGCAVFVSHFITYEPLADPISTVCCFV